MVFPLAACFWAGSLSADESLLLQRIELANGSTIFGKAREVEEDKQTYYLIELPAGEILKLRRNQVKHVINPPPAAAEYLKKLGTLADTVEAHWEMQQWCLENQLPRQREYHLMQVIRLDPDYTMARKLLGYIAPEGVWIHEDHFYQSHGYVKDSRGKYRMPAGIQLSENKDNVDKQVKDWSVRIRSVIKQYYKRGDASVLNELTAIRDPAATSGLRDALEEELAKSPRNEALQRLLIQSIGQIESYSAQNALVAIAMKPLEFLANGSTTPESERYAREIREHCIRMLKQPHFDQDAVVNSVLPFLRPKPETPVYQVHLAAAIVGEMGDKSAIPWLIDGLVTSHKQVLGGPGGNMSVSQGTGGQGLSMGSNKPKFVMVPVQNQAALDALRIMSRSMTGSRDYGFDQLGWLNWYIGTRSVGSSTLNRDE
jgi:hypothetical protein